MKEIHAEYWFSAHLHVKFAAVFEHATLSAAGPSKKGALPAESNGVSENPDEIAIDDDFDEEVVPGPPAAENPDEIAIDDDDFDEEPVASTSGMATDTATMTGNPDEIAVEDDFDDDEQIVYQPKPVENQSNGETSGRIPPNELAEALKVDESADLVVEARKDGHPELAKGVIGSQAAGPSTGTAPGSQVSPVGQFSRRELTRRPPHHLRQAKV